MTRRVFALMGIMLAAAASRLVPHPPNVAPITAIALFGGACLPDRRLAFLLPLAAMWLSDLFLGWSHPVVVAAIYGSFLLMVGLGLWVRARKTAWRIAEASLAGSVLFFLLTNFAYWTTGLLYPLTWEGLVACYVAAIPFFHNTLLGDLAYTAILFGGFALAEQRIPALREPAGLPAR